MFKSFLDNQSQQRAMPVLCSLNLLVAVNLLAALTTGGAFAQTLPEAHNKNAISTGPVKPEEITPLTLQRAIELALAGNLDLVVAKREIEVTQGRVIQGQARPNPELAYSLEDQRATTRTQSVQLNLPIELGGKRDARITAAERGRDIAIEELNIRRVEIRASVVAAFFEALASQERAVLAQESLELAKISADAVHKRLLAGKVSPVQSVARVEVAQAQSEQRSAFARLNGLLGDHPLRFATVAGSVELLPGLPTLVSLQQRLLSAPLLRRAQLEVERSISMANIERSKQVPDVTLSLGVKRSNELQRNQLLFGVSLPLPLFDQNQGNLLEALKRENKVRDELQALTASLGTTILQARERLESVRDEIDVLQRDVLTGAKSAYGAAAIGFENGKFSFLEVLDAQRTYFAARTQYLKSLAEAHRAAADIDRVLGESTANGYSVN